MRLSAVGTGRRPPRRARTCRSGCAQEGRAARRAYRRSDAEGFLCRVAHALVVRPDPSTCRQRGLGRRSAGAAARVEHLGHRARGADLPPHAMTMIGLHRMRNIRDLVTSVIQEGCAGDLMECGVWRGGATIFMRGLLRAYQVDDRRVWAADSSRACPPPRPRSSRSMPSGSPRRQVGGPAGGGTAQFRGLRSARRSSPVPPRLVQRVAPGRADRAARGPAPRWRLAGVHPGCARAPVRPGGTGWLRDHRRLRLRVLSHGCAGVPDRAGITDPIQHADWTGVWWRKTA